MSLHAHTTGMHVARHACIFPFFWISLTIFTPPVMGQRFPDSTGERVISLVAAGDLEGLRKLLEEWRQWRQLEENRYAFNYDSQGFEYRNMVHHITQSLCCASFLQSLNLSLHCQVPVQIAAQRGDVEVLRFLLANGADVDGCSTVEVDCGMFVSTGPFDFGLSIVCLA